MNNKGQTLVSFIILLPILLLLVMFVIDYSKINYDKRNIENNIKDVISYKFKNNLMDTQIEDLLKNNIDNIKTIKITSSDNFIRINIIKEANGIFNILKLNDLNITYSANLKDNSINLIKE